MRIGFLSSHDPKSRYSFSGTLFYMYHSLAAIPGVIVTPIAEQHHQKSYLRDLLYKVVSKFLPFNSPIYKKLNRYYGNRYLKLAQKELSTHSYDVLIAPVAGNLVYQIAQHVATPIIFVTDATPKFLRETYQDYVDDSQERLTLTYATSVVYSSDYMAERAKIEFADVLAHASDKVFAIPFGPNIDHVTPQLKERPMDVIQLLFVGRDWDRKRGDIAIETLKILAQKGLNCHLTIVGYSPAVALEDPSITVIPFLNKNDPEQQQLYANILHQSHFLLLPTKADCTPMVIPEANAFGVPVLTTDIGGITTLVRPGVNGYLFPVEAGADAYADVIMQAIADTKAFKILSQNSQKEYAQRLNWEAWAREIHRICKEVVPGQKSESMITSSPKA